MKKSLLFLSLAMAASGAMATIEPVTKTFQSTNDTWIRSNNGSWKPNANQIKAIEINEGAEKNESDEITGYYHFVGLIGFDYQLPEGMKVKTATLRLVTERVKANPIAIHGYANDFNESSACWNTEAAYVEPLLTAEPLATFNAAGKSGKAIWDNGLAEEFQNLAAWTNYIDVTDYVKTLTVNDRRANFMLHHIDGKAANQTCFYAREFEQEDLSEKYGYIINHDDVIPELTVIYVEDADTNNDVLDPVADTFVRSSAANNNYGNNGTMEIYWTTKKIDTKTGEPATDSTPAEDIELVPDAQFYGLMSFNIPAEVKDRTCVVTSARLRLVHTMTKSGDKTMDIYKYPVAVNEGAAKWNTEADNVAEALSSDPIASYSAKGQNDKSMSDALSDGYKTADAWTNYVDLTDYIKANPENLNILIKRRAATNGSIKIATKETGDAENTKDANNKFTFKAEDLLPHLYITYSKPGVVEDPSGVDEIEAAVNAPVEYYNLQGVRVENPSNGLFIKRQGNKTTKVIL